MPSNLNSYLYKENIAYEVFTKLIWFTGKCSFFLIKKEEEKQRSSDFIKYQLLDTFGIIILEVRHQNEHLQD